MTHRPTNQPTIRRTDRQGHWEVSLPMRLCILIIRFIRLFIILIGAIFPCPISEGIPVVVYERCKYIIRISVFRCGCSGRSSSNHDVAATAAVRVCWLSPAPAALSTTTDQSEEEQRAGRTGRRRTACREQDKEVTNSDSIEGRSRRRRQTASIIVRDRKSVV